MLEDIKLYLSLLGFSAKDIRMIEGELPLYKENYDLFLLQVEKKISSYLYKKLCKNSLEDTLGKFYEEKENLGIGVLIKGEEDYPQEFLFIENPPEVLYYRGNLQKCLRESLCGVVGARNYTNYGKVVAQDLGKNLAQRGVTLVSGMALGIDAISQRACLDGGGLSIGILGTGIDVVYPSRNHQLYLDLLDQGAILSEYPPRTQGRAFRFPERNRLIAGLSKAVIIVEAKKKSGSLITARLAAEAGKEVFAVPGNINSPYSQGCNALIRDGALVYTSSQDLDLFFPPKEEKKDLLDLSEEERKFLQYISHGVNTANRLCEETKLPIGTITSFLTILEMKSFIVNQGADQFALSPNLDLDNFLS